jgi:hypothetical protein
MYRIRQRIAGKWITVLSSYSFQHVVEEYNRTPTPKMLIDSSGIKHKQYTDNGFVYRP